MSAIVDLFDRQDWLFLAVLFCFMAFLPAVSFVTHRLQSRKVGK